jgi:hypothetical protein
MVSAYLVQGTPSALLSHIVNGMHKHGAACEYDQAWVNMARQRIAMLGEMLRQEEDSYFGGTPEGFGHHDDEGGL